MCTVASLLVCVGANSAKAETLLEAEGILTSGDAVLDDGSLYDQHIFSGSSGQQITVSLESQDFDPYLILLDPEGNRISENDDISRSNRNSQLRIILPTTGEYVVVANSYEAGKNGQYKIKIDIDNYQSSTAQAVAAAIPESTPLCNNAISSALSELSGEHEIGIMVTALRLGTLYEEILTARPNGLNMALSGPATASILASPLVLKTASTDLIRNCDTLGAVVFGSAEADVEKIFGYLPALAEQTIENNITGTSIEQQIGEFTCVETGEDAFAAEPPQWGEHVCL
ncbi:MAG: pre-peptidase C-terminal domain-containing protein [Cyanobacteria bacterium J06598_3]